MTDLGFWQQVAVQAIGGVVGGAAGVGGALGIFVLERRVARDREERAAAREMVPLLEEASRTVGELQIFFDPARKSVLDEDGKRKLESRLRTSVDDARKALASAVKRHHFDGPYDALLSAYDALEEMTRVDSGPDVDAPDDDSQSIQEAKELLERALVAMRKAARRS